MAEPLEYEAGCRGADRGSDRNDGANEPAHQIESASPGGQVDDHQNRQDGDRGGANSTEQLSSQEELGNARFTNREAPKDDG
jgi:hypothetical protein